MAPVPERSLRKLLPESFVNMIKVRNLFEIRCNNLKYGSCLIVSGKIVRRPKTVSHIRSFYKMECELQTVKHDVRNMFDSTLKAVQPNSLIRGSIAMKNDILKVENKQYVLKNNCYIIGFGKAVLGMAYETERIVGSHIVSGIVSVPEGILETMKGNPNIQPVPNSVLEIAEGAKSNLPDKSANATACKIKDLADSLNCNDLLIILISGGGSALLPFPVPPITLEEKSKVIKLLAEAGASITELNCIRKKMSVLKGGGLAKIAYPAQIVSLILSDIIGNPLDLIASGPTVVNTDAPDKALNIVKKYSLLNKLPVSVQECLKSPSNLDEHDRPTLQFPHVQNVLIGSNVNAVSSAAEAGNSLGYSTVILSLAIEGNVSDVGRMYATLATSLCKTLHDNRHTGKLKDTLQLIKENFALSANVEKNISDAIQNVNGKGLCIIAGGETTVVVKGSGVGGRNQELAMIFTRLINESSKTDSLLDGFHTIFLSAGTDGIDGPTPAAGSFGYKEQLQAAMEEGLDLYDYEKNNDSYNFYSKLKNGEDLVVTGHTGTNVMDIHILIIKPRSKVS